MLCEARGRWAARRCKLSLFRIHTVHKLHEQKGAGMKAVVVYESLWGNTAAIARAIAEGIGQGARAMSTAEASMAAIADADLIVAGAPVHSLSLPTDKTREWARIGSLGPAGAVPDLSHPKMRTWLSQLPAGRGSSAAFDTRVQGWYGRGGASKIAEGLRQAGYRLIAKPCGFYVTGHPWRPTTNGVLREGETDRACQWGAELAKAMK
jgi:hypothetical protein